MRSIYLDNSATTKVYPEVAELMCKTMLADYGNPSAKHTMGVEAEKYYRESREEIAETLKVKAKEILFTSGGTESDNMALIGGCFAKMRQGKHIISSAIEHPAIYKVLEFLESHGFEISILPVDEKGHISLNELEKTLRDDTVMVSIMTVNNEMGAVEDIHAIGELIKKKNPNCLFHTDAIQAYGKMLLHPKKDFVDLLSVSGHKLHGPKGIGFLFIDEKVKINPIIFGGGQQGGLRSGTLNIPGIAGMGLAAKRLFYRGVGEASGGEGQFRKGKGFRSADRFRIFLRSEGGSSASCPGREGNLCQQRFGLLFQSSGYFRNFESYRSH